MTFCMICVETTPSNNGRLAPGGCRLPPNGWMTPRCRRSMHGVIACCANTLSKVQGFSKSRWTSRKRPGWQKRHGTTGGCSWRRWRLATWSGCSRSSHRTEPIAEAWPTATPWRISYADAGLLRWITMPKASRRPRRWRKCRRAVKRARRHGVRGCPSYESCYRQRRTRAIFTRTRCVRRTGPAGWISWKNGHVTR